MGGGLKMLSNAESSQVWIERVFGLADDPFAACAATLCGNARRPPIDVPLVHYISGTWQTCQRRYPGRSWTSTSDRDKE